MGGDTFRLQGFSLCSDGILECCMHEKTQKPPAEISAGGFWGNGLSGWNQPPQPPEPQEPELQPPPPTGLVEVMEKPER